jgi:hypothetical protein
MITKPASTNYTSAGATVSLSVTTAKTSALTPGILYRFVCATAWHVRQGPQGTVTATTGDYLVAANKELLVRVTAAGVDDGIAAILDSATATLYVQACK